MAWSMSRPSNPVVLVVHTMAELTQKTIETCPPSRPPHPLGQMLEVPGIASIDLHRYRARLNLSPGADRDVITRQVCKVLGNAWGPAASKRREEPAQAFAVSYAGPRLVAESLRMAVSQPILRALFGVPGVTEAILEPGQVRVRLGRLHSWAEVEHDVRRALERSVFHSPT